MKKALLSLGMGMVATAAVAQVTFPVRVGFENADKEKAAAFHCQYALSPGVSEFGDWVNPHQDVDYWVEQSTDDVKNGDFSFLAQNDDNKMNPWDRGFKLANLPIKENTPYRMSFWVKGTQGNVITAWLSKGIENLDKSMISSSNSAEYGINQKVMSGEWERMSFVAFYENATPYNNWLANTSWAGGATFPEEFGGDGTATYRSFFKEQVPDIFFAIINMFDAGTYYLDDICIEEGVTFNQATWKDDVIRLDFGYATNAAALANADKHKAALLDKSQFSAKGDGAELEIKSVECRPDGYVYIFLEDNFRGDNLNVSFTPNEECPLEYGADKRPSLDHSSAMKVLGFANESALETEDDSTLDDLESSVTNLPELVSCTPENGSFDLKGTIKEFTFTFDLPVDPGTAIISLEGPSGTVGELKVQETDPTTTITAVYDGKTLKDGDYTISIEVEPEISSGDAYMTEVTFNVGNWVYDPNQSTEVKFDAEFTSDGNNAAPNHGTLMTGGNILNPGEGRGSGPRVFTDFAADGQFSAALYGRDWDGGGYYEIGTRDDEPIELSEGRHKLSFIWANWKGTTQMNVKIFKLEDGVEGAFIDKTFNNSVNVNGGKGAVAGAEECEIIIDVEEEGMYAARFEGGGEWLLANVKLEYVPNLAGVESKSKLWAAFQTAYDYYYNNCDLDNFDRYAGPEFNTLKEIVEKYEEPEDWLDKLGMTSPSQYDAATAEVVSAEKTARDYKNMIDKYDQLRVDGGVVAEVLASTADAKVAQLECWAILKNSYETYKDEALTQMDSLKTAIDLLNNNLIQVRRWNGQVVMDDGSVADPWAVVGKVGINALTARIDKAVATIEAMAPDYTEEEVAIMDKAQNAISDDDAVANELKKIATKYYYKAMVNKDENFFSPKTEMRGEGEEAEEVETFDGIYDFSFFLKNPNLYIQTSNGNLAGSLNAITNVDEETAEEVTIYEGPACPGWTVSEYTNGSWSTGWTTLMKEDLPIEAMASNWGGSYTISQSIEDLPAGLYILKGGVSERDAYHDDSYFFWQTSEDGDRVIMTVPNAGQTFPNLNMSSARVNAEWVDGVEQQVEEGEEVEDALLEILDGKLTIGAHAGLTDSHIFINNFAIYLVGAANTDYNKALTDFETGITTTGKSLKSVAVFDMNGRQIVRAAKGVNIVKRTYSDGTVKISKYLVK